MKRFFILLLALLILSLAACKKERTFGAAAGASTEANAAQSEVESLADSNPEAQAEAEPDSNWPRGVLHSVPEWKGITKYHGVGGDLDAYAQRDAPYSFGVIASEDSFFRYLDVLTNAGYNVEDYFLLPSGRGCIAEGGLIHLEIESKQFDGEWGYQLDIGFKKPGKWPSYDLPSFLFPIRERSLVEDPILYRPGANLLRVHGVWVDSTGYNFQFTYTGLSMSEAISYMNTLASRLTSGIYFTESRLEHGGFGFIKGTCLWNSRRYYCYGEVVEEDSNSYAFYFGWSVDDMGW